MKDLYIAMQCSRDDNADPLLIYAGVPALKAAALEKDISLGINNNLVR